MACTTQTTGFVQLGVCLFGASHAEVALCNTFNRSGYSHRARFRSFLRNDVILNLLKRNVSAHVALGSGSSVKAAEVLDTVTQAEGVSVVEESDLVSLGVPSIGSSERGVLLVEP